MKYINTQNLQYPAQTFVNSMGLIETGHHEVNADGDPDLGAHGVLRGPEEGLDPQILFDPLKEEFDLPATLVDRRNSQSRQVEMVGQKAKALTRFRINITDTSKRLRIVDLSLSGAQADDLIAAQPSIIVDRFGLQDIEPSITLRANHEIRPCLFDTEEPGKVEVTPVEDIDASFFEIHCIHEMNVVHGAIGYPHEYRDWAVQVNLSVQLDRRLCAAEMGPGEHRQAQVDSGSVHGINHLIKIESIGVCGIKVSCLANKDLSECFIDTPVSMLVGIGEVRSGDIAANAHRIAVGTTTETRFNVAETLTESDLRKDHCEKLITGGHALACPRHRVLVDAPRQLLWVECIGNLSKNKASRVHPLLRMDTLIQIQPIQMQDMVFSSLAA